MTDLNRFWTALDDRATLAAVRGEWAAALGPVFPWAEPFFQVRAECGARFAGPPGHPGYDIIRHGPGDFTGVVRETDEVVVLSPADVAVLELDRGRVGRAMAVALEIHPPGAAHAEKALMALGRFASPLGSHACYLAFPADPAELREACHRLIAGRQAPFLLLVPTARWVSADAVAATQAHASAVVPLAEVLAADEPGRFRRARPLAGFVPGAAVPARLVNAFRRRGKVWDVWFEGDQTFVQDLVGVRYIAILLREKGRDCAAVELRAEAAGVAGHEPLDGQRRREPEELRRFKTEIEDRQHRLAEAQEFGDGATAERLQSEIDVLAAELKAPAGLGGRPRLVLDEGDSARTSVKQAITRAIEKQIADPLPAFARHLEVALETGEMLTYRPVPDVVWEL
jgi:hypothetical protein